MESLVFLTGRGKVKWGHNRRCEKKISEESPGRGEERLFRRGRKTQGTEK